MPPPGNNVRVLVEMRVPAGTPTHFALSAAAQLPAPSFKVDAGFHPVPMNPPTPAGGMVAAAPQTVIVRGTVDEAEIQHLENHADVVKVWRDPQILPMARAAAGRDGGEEKIFVRPSPGMAACPIGTCDCDPSTAKGTIADVAAYLHVTDIWAAGIRGNGIVVGVVDGGTLAVGRSTPGKVPRVIGGFPTTDWGQSALWGEHGCMTSTDVLGMAPDAQLYDIRIADAPDVTSLLSTALSGFQWAIDQFHTNGTPHILTNSWGIFQQSWAPDYATDPNHPFTRKVVEALDAGIIVLFAAGNCGDTCPDGRCGPDTGAGRSIWGANGHPRVMTVGAVNKNEQFVGYSSRGPAALDPNKPDFCSITHFAGYFPNVNPSEPADTGTSAATPIAAGVVALLKQAKTSATQDDIKNALKSTAKDIGPVGFDQVSGAGIIQGKAAYDQVVGHTLPKKLLDDVPPKKLRDDGGTVKKLMDDPQHKKILDDGKKHRDDPIKKIRDDGTVKKLRDDPPPKKTVDDSKKLRDDPIKKVRDDGGGIKKLRDDPVKKVRDDPNVKKLRDDVVGKPPFDLPGPPGLPPPGDPGPGIGQMPFALATPHHAPGLSGYGFDATGAVASDGDITIASYEQAIAELTAQLQALQEEYAAYLHGYSGG